MKRFWIVVMSLFAFSPVFAQQQTLITGKVDHGGFGGPVLKGIQIGNDAGLMVGGRGGWIVDHRFVLGGGGYGLVTEIEAPGDSLLNLGYGGLWLDAILKSDDLLHFTAGTMIGAGGISTRSSGGIGQTDYNSHDDYGQFFILEPEVNAELNVTSFFRIAAGVSYQYFSGIDAYGFTDQDFNGWAANLTFKFGAF